MSPRDRRGPWRGEADRPLGSAILADFGAPARREDLVPSDEAEIPSLDKRLARVDLGWNIVRCLEQLATGRTPEKDRQRILRELVDYERDRLLELYYADYGTELDEDTLGARGYRILRFEPTTPRDAIMRDAKRLHDTGADVAFVTTRTLATKAPLSPNDLNALTARGYEIIDLTTSGAPIGGLRSAIAPHERQGFLVEFDDRGRLAVLRVAPSTPFNPRRGGR